MTEYLGQDSCRAVAGVWKRLWEEDPLGDSEGADRDTLVLWMQTPCGIYVDMRLPNGSPGRSSKCATDSGFSPNPRALSGVDAAPHRREFSEVMISTLLSQKSFAGVLMYSSGDTTNGTALQKDKVLADFASQEMKGPIDTACISLCTCFWRRDVDYQPPSGGLDVGVCASGPPNPGGTVDLRETGDDASYAEGWRRSSTTTKGPFMALRLVSEAGHDGGRVGYWVRVGNQFAYVIGRPVDTDTSRKLGCHERSTKVKDCNGKSLEKATTQLAGEASLDRLCLAWDYICVMGKARAGSWRITSSLHPELVGCALFGDKNDQLACSLITRESDGTLTQVLIPDGQTRRWQVVQLVDCHLPTSGS